MQPHRACSTRGGGAGAGDRASDERADGRRPGESRPVRRHERGRPGPPGGRFGRRAAAGGRVDAGVPVPGGHAAGSGRGADRPCARGCARREPGLRRPGHHRHAGQPPELRTRRPGPQHPVVLPRLDRSHHLRGGDLGRLPRPGHPADGLAGRPLPARRPSSAGPPSCSVSWWPPRDSPSTSSCSSWPASAPASRSRARNSVHGSLLADTYPDQRARPAVRRHGHGAAALAMAASPLLVGLIATEVGGPNGWRWAFYILAIPILLVAVFAFRIPEPPRGQFEKKDVLGEVLGDTPPGRAVVRGGVRADHAHPHDQDGPHRLLGHRVRALHRARCWATSISSSASGSMPSSAASSAPSAASGCWSRCPSSGGTTTASTARTRRGHSRSSARSSSRLRRPRPHSVLHAERGPLGRSSACRAASSS